MGIDRRGADAARAGCVVDKRHGRCGPLGLTVLISRPSSRGRGGEADEGQQLVLVKDGFRRVRACACIGVCVARACMRVPLVCVRACRGAYPASVPAGPECRARVPALVGPAHRRSPGYSRSLASRSPAREGVRPAVSCAAARAAVPDSGAAGRGAAVEWGDGVEWGLHGSAHPTRMGPAGGEHAPCRRWMLAVRVRCYADLLAWMVQLASPAVELDERRVASRCREQWRPSTRLPGAAPSGPRSRFRGCA
jgi:hypothetical protein